jgi:hypothetical protein
MVKEGTPGKYLLRAVVPGSRQSLIESHATRDAVDARRAALERAGYNVVVTLADLLAEGEFLMLEARRRLRGAFRLRDLKRTLAPRGRLPRHVGKRRADGPSIGRGSGMASQRADFRPWRRCITHSRASFTWRSVPPPVKSQRRTKAIEELGEREPLFVSPVADMPTIQRDVIEPYARVKIIIIIRRWQISDRPMPRERQANLHQRPSWAATINSAAVGSFIIACRPSPARARPGGGWLPCETASRAGLDAKRRFLRRRMQSA